MLFAKSPNSHTYPNSTYRNSTYAFWPLKNATILVREGFQKNKKLDFFSRRANHFFIFEKLCNTGMNFRLFAQFLLLNFGFSLSISFLAVKISLGISDSDLNFLFIGIIFSVYENLVNSESSFLIRKYFSNFKQKSNFNSRIDIFDTVSIIRNPPGAQIVT